MKFVRNLADTSLADAPIIGHSLALLAEAERKSVSSGLTVTSTRVLTTAAYNRFIEFNKLQSHIKSGWRGYLKAQEADRHGLAVRLRAKVRRAVMPPEIVRELESLLKNVRPTAVERGVVIGLELICEGRSLTSVIKQPSYCGNFTTASLSRAVQSAFSSIYSDKALTEWEATDLDLSVLTMALSFQKIPLNKAIIGGRVDTRESDLNTAALAAVRAGYIPSQAGLQQKNKIIYDTYVVFKTGLEEGRESIVQKRLISKRTSVVATESGFAVKPLALSARQAALLAPKEVLKLVKGAIEIEKQFGFPVSIAWNKNADGVIEINKILPQTFAPLGGGAIKKFNFTEIPPAEKVRATGIGYGERIASGKIVIIKNEKQLTDFATGDILVAEQVMPSWQASLRRAGALVVKKEKANQALGVWARELEIPIIVAEKGFARLRPNNLVTVSTLNTLQAAIYDGAWSFYSEIFDPKESPANHQLPVWLHMLPGERVGETALLPAQGGVYTSKIFEKSTPEELATQIALVAGSFFPRTFLVNYSQLVWSSTTLERIVAVLKLVRNQWGITNVGLIIPNGPTPEATETILKQLHAEGFEPGKNNFALYLATSDIMGQEFFKRMNEPVTGWMLDISRFNSSLTDQDKTSIYTAIRLAHAHRQKVVALMSQLPRAENGLLPLLVQEKIDSLIISPLAYLRLLPDIGVLEQKYRGLFATRVWSQSRAFERLPEKALSTLGVVGLSISLAGYTCQTAVPPVPSTDLAANLQQQMADLKTELKQDITTEIDRRVTEAVSSYREDELAHFTLRYPASWGITRSATMVRLASPDNQSWFTISRLPQPKNRPDEVSAWRGFDSVRSSRYDPTSSTTALSLTVYPEASDKDASSIVFTGDAAHFDAMLNNISEFKLVEEKKK